MFPLPTDVLRPLQRRTEQDDDRVRDRRMRRRIRRVWGRRAVNIFLIWHCFALTIWLVPGNWPIVQAIIPFGSGGPIRSYLAATGFQQSWLMFSPNPANLDIFLTAHVLLRDGTSRDFTFPRMRDMQYGPRYQKERWRKLEEVAMYQAPLWSSLADYAAQQVDRNPKNPAVFVSLTRHWRPVPPPGEKWTSYTNELFYRQAIVEKAGRS